uniref:Uncharacterized protein n=1 Tax=Oryza meridionalis TaxID=40149 RepID=A0A0E0FBD8_9ORYZ
MAADLGAGSPGSGHRLAGSGGGGDNGGGSSPPPFFTSAGGGEQRWRWIWGPVEATHEAPAPPTRGLGLWLRPSRAQARRFGRFFCKRRIEVQSHGPHCHGCACPTWRFATTS